MRARSLLALVLTAGMIATPALSGEVVVFAAASMKTALDKVAADFEASSGHKVTISYAGSNALAKQIIEGAPADVFISAAVNWMDEAEKAGTLVQRRDLLGNSLVVVGRKDDKAALDLADKSALSARLQGGHLAMALVDAVPAGQYGKAALTSLALWEGVEAQVAQADNVRAALVLVSRAEAPLGIVYATDAAADPEVAVVATFPVGSHPAIVYPAALLTGAKDDVDRAFYDALSGVAASAVFQAEGFSVLK